ncbi:MAG: alpha/beta hydrolase, partial [Chloroflexi bacterium]|nr:alpha/beta hydrolase [Chloroflexota bacterium]
MTSFTLGTATLNYTDVGTGLPFVFEHGIGGDVRQSSKVLSPPSGVRLLRYDARAHGSTVWSGDPHELSFDRFGDDLIGLLNHLGIARAVVGGISMGAGVALNAATRYPERIAGLVLARPAWLARPMPRRIIALFDLVASALRELDFSIDTEEGLDCAPSKLEANPSFSAIARSYPDTAWSLRKQFTVERAVDRVARLERLPRDRPCTDLRQLQALDVPTLVLAHRQDPIHPFAYGRRLADAI